MTYESDLVPCSIVLAAGWTAEEDPDVDDGNPFVAVRPPARDARLRLTPFDPQTAGITAADWLELAASIHRRRGRPVVPVSCGDFSGYLTESDTGDDRWVRGWVLRAGSVPLDVTYSCAVSEAGRDDAEVGEMLATLRLR